jgi:hypothetical protein
MKLDRKISPEIFLSSYVVLGQTTRVQKKKKKQPAKQMQNAICVRLRKSNPYFATGISKFEKRENFQFPNRQPGFPFPNRNGDPRFQLANRNSRFQIASGAPRFQIANRDSRFQIANGDIHLGLHKNLRMAKVSVVVSYHKISGAH